MPIIIIVNFNSFPCRSEKIGEGEREQPREGSSTEAGGRSSKRLKVASKQTNRNSTGSPTVINDHLIVILSPIKGVTPREASPRYSDAIEDHARIWLSRTGTYKQ